jgi:hypothetical protein
MRTSATQVRDLVLDRADRLSSLAASLSMVVDLLEGRVDAAAANGVCCGTRATLVAVLSHFLELELEPELELLESGCNMDQMEDQVDAL